MFLIRFDSNNFHRQHNKASEPIAAPVPTNDNPSSCKKGNTLFKQGLIKSDDETSSKKDRPRSSWSGKQEEAISRPSGKGLMVFCDVGNDIRPALQPWKLLICLSQLSDDLQ